MTSNQLIVPEKDYQLIVERIRNILKRKKYLEAHPQGNLEETVEDITSLLQELEGLTEEDGVNESLVRNEIQKYVHERVSLTKLEDGVDDIRSAVEYNQRYWLAQDLTSKQIIHKVGFGKVIALDDFISKSSQILSIISDLYEPVEAITEFEISGKTFDSTEAISQYFLQHKDNSVPTKYKGTIYFGGQNLEGHITTLEREHVSLEGCIISFMGIFPSLVIGAISDNIDARTSTYAFPWLRNNFWLAISIAAGLTMSGPITFGIYEYIQYLGKTKQVNGLSISLRSKRTSYNQDDLDKLEHTINALHQYRITS
ncbi:hypothetical protein KY330_03490 [Candidatus Woesearchaeota archaeon]|nr:hypothetical protein [Candidatus Woesearchaeota archaeon]